MTHTPRRSAISLSTLVGFAKLVQTFYLCAASYTHIIKPVQPRSQNPESIAVSQMIEAALQTKREKHSAKIDALLEAQQAQIAVQLAEKELHITAMYEARFWQLEHMMQSGSSSELTRQKDVLDKVSPARLMVRSSVGSRSGNAIICFLFS